MLQHVYERACRASRLSEVWVATDDRRIHDLVASFGGRVVMTAADHACGSDRVAEVAALPLAAGAEIIVNVQGDQPLIDPEALDRLVAAFDGDPALRMATLYEPIKDAGELRDPNVCKVVGDAAGYALYFSRSPIPWYRDGDALTGRFKHVGVYAFRKEFLFEFGRLPRGRLEAAESLEQLRVLEAGHRIRLVPSAGVSISVETPADIERVEAFMH
jgi:3-deoxy-manno-octulosonate cytidylyltransferase (CMP-KDO synthetase)